MQPMVRRAKLQQTPGVGETLQPITEAHGQHEVCSVKFCRTIEIRVCANMGK